MTQPNARIGISSVDDIDDDDLVRNKMFELLDMFQGFIILPKNARIIVKVNLCLLLGCETGATVDPRLVKYLAEWFLNNYSISEIVIAESDATALNADLAYYGLGWNLILGDIPKLRYLNLSKDELVKIKIDGLLFKELEMSKTFMEADYLISFAKLKTHSMQVMSGIMKNQFGALPEKLKVVYHPKLKEAICDLVRVRPPDFCLVDGLIAQEGPGPVSGIPRVMKLIIAGTDHLATDHVCARLMGKNPLHVPHLKLAGQHNLGTSSYEIVGCCVKDVAKNFQSIPQWRQAWMWVREHIH